MHESDPRHEGSRDRIVVGGASGFMGQSIVRAWRDAGAEVITVGRRDAVRWDDNRALAAAVDGASLVIGLAGRSVNCRYGPAERAEILHSRLETTRALAAAIGAATRPPSLWVSSSTATIYRHAEDRPMTESTGELGRGFSVSVARAWEDALMERDLPATRRVALRTAIVLGDGSVLPPLVRLARLGLGGPHWDGPWPVSRARIAAGTEHRFGAPWGRQKFSWIHVDDVVAIIQFLRDHPHLAGPVNASAPNPVDDASFMRAIRRALGVPFGVPLPRPALELGALFLRTETELVLKSRWVIPERLLAAGYRFHFPTVERALDDILGRRAAMTRSRVAQGSAEG